ncbi:MAG: aldo/keto reductase [Elainellaceae cyanobacterium]
MQYRTLGRTGLSVSALGIGAWQLSGPLLVDGKADGFPDIGRDKAIDLIRACADLGINFVDTAPIYGDGEGERRVGLATRADRERWVLCTKFGLSRGHNGEKIKDAAPSKIRSSLAESLKRLQTDYVDVYLYHSPPDGRQIPEGKEVLESLKQEGKIRFYGISTNDQKALGRLASQRSVDVAMFSQSLVTHSPKILNLIEENALGGIVRGAFEAGRLSGRYFHEQPQFSSQDIRKQAIDSSETKKYAVYEKLLPDKTLMPAFALRYLLDFDTTHTIVLGGKSLDHYKAALEAFRLPALTTQERKALRETRHKLLKKPLRTLAADLVRRAASRLL